MKVVKKTTKLIDNPNYQKGNKQKKKIQQVSYTDIDISYLLNTCISYRDCDGQFEGLLKRVAFLEDLVKILIETNKSNEILSFLANKRNGSKHHYEECGDEYLVVDE